VKIVTVSILILLLAAAAFSQKMTDLDKLVATERAFARAAAEKSTKEAFLEFLADDSIVFEPNPVNGKDTWSKRPPSVGLLSWEPVWADISSDGTIGYTTGPWEFRPKGKYGDPVAFGEYVTIWKKQKDGNFKAILDIGISHGKPEGDKPELGFAKGGGADQVTIRVYRDGEFVMTGKDAKARLSAEGGVKTGDCTEAGDLRYCYGTAKISFESEKTKHGNLLFIEKLYSGKWISVLDLFTEIPE